MIDDIVSLFPRWAVLFALVFGIFISSAAAQQVERDRQNNSVADIPEPASHSPAQPLTEFEKMQLHHRRYSAAANNMASLFKLLNQKIQEVTLAAKTFEAKDNSHNRRQLEAKLHQLENARVAYNIQYLQLQSQMQNEYRNHAAISSDLKTRYDDDTAGENRGETARNAGSAKAKSVGNKPAKTKGTKDKDTGNHHAKAKESRIEEESVADSPARDPRVLDLDTKEVRARREGRSTFEPSESSQSAPQPSLNIVH